MINHLKGMFECSNRLEWFDTGKKLFVYKQGENDPVVPHVHQMMGYIDYLAKLGFPLPNEYAVDLILHSLNSNFSNFIMNYVLKDDDPPLNELLGLLRSAEHAMQKSKPKAIMMVNSGKTKRKKNSKKNKKGSRSSWLLLRLLSLRVECLRTNRVTNVTSVENCDISNKAKGSEEE